MESNPVAIKTLLLLLGFIFFSAGALLAPMVGVVGYILHYHLWPDNQWWGRELSDWGLRYAFTIGLCLLIGTILNKHKLSLGKRVMKGHEWLLVLFWVAMTVSIIAGVDLTLRQTDQLYQSVLLDKMTKVLLFCLLLSHVVTTPRRLDILMWTLIVGTLYVGYQAWDAPPWRFARARLDGIGGPDFRESSFLAAHFVMMLALIGAQFLRSNWHGRAFCIIAGFFAVNGLILTRTRAAFLAMCVGVVAALLLGVRGKRHKILFYLIPGIIAAAFLTDDGFRERMKTIALQPDTMDTSASNRLLLWEGSGQMFVEHPLGVGLGNFAAEMGKYNPELARRDAHSTYIRCICELGVFGAGTLALIVLSAFWCLRRAQQYAWRCQDSLQLRCHIYGISVALLIMMTTSLFMTQLYIEEFWWILTLPVCVLRAAEWQYAHRRAEAPAELIEDSMDLLPAEPGWGWRPA